MTGLETIDPIAANRDQVRVERRARLRDTLRQARAESQYEGTRFLCFLAAAGAVITLWVALWPVDKVEHRMVGNSYVETMHVLNTVRSWLCAASTLAVAMIWALARASIDRCDLALRTALKNEIAP